MAEHKKYHRISIYKYLLHINRPHCAHHWMTLCAACLVPLPCLLHQRHLLQFQGPGLSHLFQKSILAPKSILECDHVCLANQSSQCSLKRKSRYCFYSKDQHGQDSHILLHWTAIHSLSWPAPESCSDTVSQLIHVPIVVQVPWMPHANRREILFVSITAPNPQPVDGLHIVC